MSPLTPLRASSDDELELALLKSVDDDEPGPGALPKAALALGLGASLVTVATSAVGAGTAKAAAAGGTLAKHTSITALSLLKWLAVGATAGLVTSGSAHLALRPLASPAPPTHTAETTAPKRSHEAPARTTARSAPVAQEERETVAVEPAPPAASAFSVEPEKPAPLPTARPSSVSAEAKRSAPTAPLQGESSAALGALPLTPPPPATAPTSPISSLTEETRALDHVRHELEARRPASALAELERFRTTWPNAALRAEAAVLRVEALLRAGDRKTAERQAAVLIQAAPRSRHAARVRELLAR